MNDSHIVISGAAESERLGAVPDMSALELGADAARRAMQDAGLNIHDIDGVAALGGPFGPGPVTFAHYLGIRPTWLDATCLGGGTFVMFVAHAAAAIRAGACRAVLIIHGESGRSRIGMPPRPLDPASLEGQFESPYGPPGAVHRFTLPALRYLKETGTTREQLAGVAVAQRTWASRNERAARRTPITVEEVLSSRVVAYPFTSPEVCLISDGGGAVVVTTAQLAEEHVEPHRLVHLWGQGEAMDAPMISAMSDMTTSEGYRRSSAAAFKTAGVGPSDVDHLMIYDAFAHLPLMALEDAGFVQRGEAGAFIEEGHLSLIHI